VAKPPRAAPGLAARGGTAVTPRHKGTPCPTGPSPSTPWSEAATPLLSGAPRRNPHRHPQCRARGVRLRRRGLLLLSACLKGVEAAAARMRAPLADLRDKVAASRVGASAALAALCAGLEQRAAATSARELLELLLDTSQRHRRRPRHPECATPPSPSKPPRRRSERAAPLPPCLRVHVRCRQPSPIAPVPRCPPRRRTLEPLPRSSSSLPSPSCHHLAKGCAPSAPSLPYRCPCSPAFPPLAACKVFEAMPEPRAASTAPPIAHFRSFGLWHVGSHSPFRC
jgi:hypothetical protein